MGDRTRLDADDEGITSDVVAQGTEEITGRNTQKDRRNRQEQEGECNRSRGREQGGEERPHSFFFFGRPKPACASSSRPRLETTCFTKALPAARCELAFTTASS